MGVHERARAADNAAIGAEERRRTVAGAATMPLEMWHCPHCGAPQAETARCWVCRRSSTTCSTCTHFRRALAGDLGYCGLDARRRPLTGLEQRGCWEPKTARRPSPRAPSESRRSSRTGCAADARLSRRTATTERRPARLRPGRVARRRESGQKSAARAVSPVRPQRPPSRALSSRPRPTHCRRRARRRRSSSSPIRAGKGGRACSAIPRTEPPAQAGPVRLARRGRSSVRAGRPSRDRSRARPPLRLRAAAAARRPRPRRRWGRRCSRPRIRRSRCSLWPPGGAIALVVADGQVGRLRGRRRWRRGRRWRRRRRRLRGRRGLGPAGDDKLDRRALGHELAGTRNVADHRALGHDLVELLGPGSRR